MAHIGGTRGNGDAEKFQLAACSSQRAGQVGTEVGIRLLVKSYTLLVIRENAFEILGRSAGMQDSNW
jgi:hypothetical protein